MSTITAAIEAFISHKSPLWAENSVKVYAQCAARWEAFCKVHLPPSLAELQQPGQTTAIGDAFLAYLQGQGLSVNTQDKCLSFLRSVLKDAMRRAGYRFDMANWPAVSVHREAWNIPVDFTQAILDWPADDMPTPVHQQVLFAMQVQIVTCLRFSDLSRVTADMITTGDVLVIRNKKGNKRTYHPLPYWIADKLCHLGRVLPEGFSNRDYNAWMLAVLDEIPASRQRIEVARQDKSGKVRYEQVRLIDLATSHFLRKAGITRYVMKGLDRALLCRMTGHSPNSPVLNQVYAGLDPGVLAKALENINKPDAE